uniref:Zn(2)-C6 fungal-type domain-containing protein n=1 Tax=Ganoderma boninense TaxID=34458 RepID=A0A5K1K4Q9_9APHY|nr:Zn(2)-C6 fungal-type domain-containing protein [Ganoderma boninense]
MRVLDTETGHFVEKDPEETRYAILSHTWDNEKGEQTYKELRKIQLRYCVGPQFTQSHSRDASQSTTSSTKGHHREYSFPIPSFLHLPLTETPFLTPSEFSPIQLQADIYPLSSPTADSDESFEIGSLTSLSLEEGHHEASLLRSIWDEASLSPKIREACAVARANGFRYIWIDSCCIDKSSSSELSEAINWIYVWYAKAAVCYAYLADVPPGEDHRALGSQFRKSRWFTRGWTLQELIAPAHVVFLAQDWAVIGSKHAVVDLVESITEIDHMALLHLEPLDKFSVSQRLSWAARRETKRMEDQAYSLLGIFDINMPTLYGEGNRAFRRLLEQIMQRTPDQSLFAWGDVYLGPQILPLPSAVTSAQDSQSFECFTYTEFPSLLAIQPSLFMNSGSIRTAPLDTVREIQTQKAHYYEIEYTSTPYGIRTQFQMIPLSHCFPSRTIRYDAQGMEAWQWYLAILGCEHKDHPGHLLGRVCFVPPSERGVEYLYPGFVCVSSTSTSTSPAQHDERWADHFPLFPDTIRRVRGLVEAKTVYLAHPNRAPTPAPDALLQQRERSTVTLVLLPETCAALRASRYNAELRGPVQDAARPRTGTHRLTLTQDPDSGSNVSVNVNFAVEFEHTLEEDGKRFTITARIAVETSDSEPLPLGAVRPRASAEPSTVSWTDGRPWGAKLMRERVTVTLQGGGAGELALDLGLDFAGMGIYFLRVDILNGAALGAGTASSASLRGGGRRVGSTGSEGSAGTDTGTGGGRRGYWRQVAFWRAA